MPRSVNRKSISLEKEVVTKFEYLYPKLTGIFCTRALKLALANKDVFELIFFNPIFTEVK